MKLLLGGKSSVLAKISEKLVLTRVNRRLETHHGDRLMAELELRGKTQTQTQSFVVQDDQKSNTDL